MLKTADIRIRDPFILTEQKSKMYYLYGTTDENVWSGKGTGFDVYKSEDLLVWDGPFSAFRPEKDFWADQNFWAPEVHLYEGKYYMMATFKADDKCRGTQILVSDNPLGPFSPITDHPTTPGNWECLDGTLFIDHDNNPWMIFCHEWLQVQDGEMRAIRLSKDLKTAISDPILLFKASEAKWTVAKNGVNFITDGPFIHRTRNNQLLMLWSSQGEKGYAIGVSRSQSGTILGPWIHETDVLFGKDGGHGMLFHTLEGQLMLTIHAPNSTPNERPVFFEIIENDEKLFLK